MIGIQEALEIFEELPERLRTYEAEYLWEDKRLGEAIKVAIAILEKRLMEGDEE